MHSGYLDEITYQQASLKFSDCVFSFEFIQIQISFWILGMSQLLVSSLWLQKQNNI